MGKRDASPLLLPRQPDTYWRRDSGDEDGRGRSHWGAHKNQLSDQGLTYAGPELRLGDSSGTNSAAVGIVRSDHTLAKSYASTTCRSPCSRWGATKDVCADCELLDYVALRHSQQGLAGRRAPVPARPLCARAGRISARLSRGQRFQRLRIHHAFHDSTVRVAAHDHVRTPSTPRRIRCRRTLPRASGYGGKILPTTPQMKTRQARSESQYMYTDSMRNPRKR